MDQLKKLTDEEVSLALRSLPGWTLENGKLHREFKFMDFSRAVGFITSVAIQAEAMNHHPEWFNVYDTVRVWLVTHDVNGVSSLDIDLARRLNDLYVR